MTGLAEQRVRAHLQQAGINDIRELIYDPGFDLLFREETASDLQGHETGTVTSTGAVSVDTGVFTGRSPRDKYIVRDNLTRETV